MLRSDLEVAGIEFETEEGVFDFHALRHTFLTRLARSGIPPKVAQTLARHSTITLTMDRYAHVALHDQTSALESLPGLPEVEHKDALAATGTDEEFPLQFPLEGDFPCQHVATDGNGASVVDNHRFGPNSVNDVEFGNECQTPVSDWQSTPGRNRTCNLRIRSPLLYPIELRARTRTVG